MWLFGCHWSLRKGSGKSSGLWTSRMEAWASSLRIVQPSTRASGPKGTELPDGEGQVKLH
jgi:hypothetical protein